MKEIDANKQAWSQLSEAHYETFKKRLLDGTHYLNKYIRDDLCDIRGKNLIHLQCNTGADSILLAQMGANVTGVDFVPDNIFYANKLAADFNIDNISFFESDIMELTAKHESKYDIVFVSEGALGWLPSLDVWGLTVRQLLNDNGYLYVFDSHPFYLMMDEHKFSRYLLEVEAPYFNKEPVMDDYTGGYASERKYGAKAYFWPYTVSDIINSLTAAGMHIDYFNEYPELFFDAGGMTQLGDSGLYNYVFNDNKYPMSFSLKATVWK